MSWFIFSVWTHINLFCTVPYMKLVHELLCGKDYMQNNAFQSSGTWSRKSLTAANCVFKNQFTVHGTIYMRDDFCKICLPLSAFPFIQCESLNCSNLTGTIQRYNLFYQARSQAQVLLSVSHITLITSVVPGHKQYPGPAAREELDTTYIPTRFTNGEGNQRGQIPRMFGPDTKGIKGALQYSQCTTLTHA